jgi:hypothetical protein
MGREDELKGSVTESSFFVVFSVFQILQHLLGPNIGSSPSRGTVHPRFLEEKARGLGPSIVSLNTNKFSSSSGFSVKNFAKIWIRKLVQKIAICLAPSLPLSLPP